ncbi:MAG TPA: hypothetical protein VIQ05_23195 [Tardiphaga sp.]
MLDLLNKPENDTDNATSTAAKRERIEAELRADASRSDRKIAEVVGCDHKTVGAARARLGNSISPDEPIAGSTPKFPPHIDKIVETAVDQITGAKIRDRNAREAAVDEAGERNQELCLLPPRKEVTIQHDDDRGEWVFRQRNWPDEDGVISISDEDIHPFIDILTDHLGYGRICGS